MQSVPASEEKQQEPNCWIGPVPEDSVLKTGLLSVCRTLGEEGLLDFPRRPNGSPLLMRQGFFERLLRKEVSLQDCPAADASSAEADIGKLNLCQLLAIRCSHFERANTTQTSMVSFLLHLDRHIMTSLAERLLGSDAPACGNASLALSMRHVVLIYGAAEELSSAASFAASWWLILVGGFKRYLHLPSCRMSSKPPLEAVCCYRSQTTASLYDPRRKRIFRWHVTLVSTPEEWTEEPDCLEANGVSALAHSEAALHDEAKTMDRDTPPIHSSEEENCNMYHRKSFLFADFNIEELLASIEESSEGGSSCRNSLRKRSDTGSIDEFFDTLWSAAIITTPSDANHEEAASGRMHKDSTTNQDAVEPCSDGDAQKESARNEPGDVGSTAELMRTLQSLQARLEASEQARLEASRAACVALEKEARANLRVEELERLLEEARSVAAGATRQSETGHSISPIVMHRCEEVTSASGRNIYVYEDEETCTALELEAARIASTSASAMMVATNMGEATTPPDCDGAEHAACRKELEEMRNQLNKTKMQCRSLLRRLRDVDKQHEAPQTSHRKILDVSDDCILEKIDDLEAENARLTDLTCESAALYVPKIQELTSELHEAQLELEQAMESQRGLQQDVVGKAQVIEELLRRCQKAGSKSNVLSGMSLTLPRFRSAVSGSSASVRSGLGNDGLKHVDKKHVRQKRNWNRGCDARLLCSARHPSFNS